MRLRYQLISNGRTIDLLVQMSIMGFQQLAHDVHGRRRITAISSAINEH